jgi:protein SDA1
LLAKSQNPPETSLVTWLFFTFTMSGIATGAGTRPDVTLKIAQLQNLCKRDPTGYREDYDAQIRRLRSECGILALSPSTNPSPRLVELIQFAAAVSSSSYKGAESDSIAELLMALLLGVGETTAYGESPQSSSFTASHRKQVNMNIPISALSLHKDIRKSCVSALILMRNKGAIAPLKLMELFFRIMAAVPDKALREHLYKHLVNDIQNINKKGKRDDKVNRSVQIFLHRIISDSSSATQARGVHHENMDDDGYFDSKGIQEEKESARDIAAKRAVDMVAELYRRQVWTDERAVAILASAVRSSNTSVMCKAIRFFLNIEEKMADDQQKAENEKWDGVNQVDMHLYSKKTKVCGIIYVVLM